MLTDTEKKQILTSILDMVSDYSNKEYQKKAWISEGKFGYAYDDSVCDFFPSIEDILRNYKDFKITEDQYQILKKFTEEFQEFSDENDYPEQFIDSPEWTKIMERAKEVLKAFNYKKET